MIPYIQSNKIRKAYAKVLEAKSGIDIALTKRYDLLTHSYAILNKYLDGETRLVKEAIQIHQNMSAQEMSDASRYMDDLARRLIDTVRLNMETNTNPVFQEVLKQIQDSEEHLQAARRLYNANVTILNELICSYTGRKIAEKMNIDEEYYFEAYSHKKEDVEFQRK